MLLDRSFAHVATVGPAKVGSVMITMILKTTRRTCRIGS